MGAEPTARVKSVRCAGRGGFHRVVYRDIGPIDSPHAVLCVHGLTRNGRDFTRLARALAADGWRVICPDVAGRGESEPLVEAEDYGLPQYVSDLTTVLAHARVESVDWVGTSMGGLIALLTAATPGHPIRRLCLNDVGPIVPKAALQRIADYVGVAWRFESFEEAFGHLKQAYAPFGLTQEADWRELAEISLRRADDGSYSNKYDLRIAQPFAALAGEDLANANRRRLFPDPNQSQQAQVAAGVAQAQAGVDLANANVERLYPDPNESQEVQAEAGIIEAESALELAKLNREYAEMRAPFDGVVSEVDIDPGDPAMGARDFAMQIVDMDNLHVDVDISDVDISDVQIGANANVYADALPGETFTGEVSYIAPMADVQGNVRTYTVRIELERIKGLRPGMSVRVEIETEE